MKSLKALSLNWNASPIDGPPKSAAGILTHAEESSLNSIWIDITKSEAGLRKLHSESQKYQQAIKDVQLTEEKLVKSLCDSNVGNFSPELNQIGDEYLSTVSELKENSKESSKSVHDFVSSSSKPYYNMYEHLNNFKRKRDQCISDFQKSQDKYDKLKLKGKRSTDVLVDKEKKLKNLRDTNTKLIESSRKFHDSRIPFLNATLEGLVHSQLHYYGNAVSQYNQQIQVSKKGHSINDREYSSLMNGCLDKIKQLDIVDA